jgi:hypothetical protein
LHLMRAPRYRGFGAAKELAKFRKYCWGGQGHGFGLADTDEAPRTVGGEGRPGAIHCAVDPWR